MNDFKDGSKGQRLLSCEGEFDVSFNVGFESFEGFEGCCQWKICMRIKVLLMLALGSQD